MSHRPPSLQSSPAVAPSESVWGRAIWPDGVLLEGIGTGSLRRLRVTQPGGRPCELPLPLEDCPACGEPCERSFAPGIFLSPAGRLQAYELCRGCYLRFYGGPKPPPALVQAVERALTGRLIRGGVW